MVAYRVVWCEFKKEKELKNMSLKKLKNEINEIRKFEKEISKKEKEGYKKIHDSGSNYDWLIKDCKNIARNSRIKIEKFFFKKNQLKIKI